RRGRRRPRRPHPRLPGLEGRHGEPAPHAGGRAHPRPAVLRRQRPVGLRERPPGGRASARAHQPAFAAAVPGERAGGERTRVLERILLQAGSAEDQAAGEGLQDMVTLRPVLLSMLLSGAALAAEPATATAQTPLATLPYTPGLDPASMD